MTWAEFTAARQLLVEEKIGAPLRAQQAQEDAQTEALKDALRRQGGAR